MKKLLGVNKNWRLHCFGAAIIINSLSTEQADIGDKICGIFVVVVVVVVVSVVGLT